MYVLTIDRRRDAVVITRGTVKRTIGSKQYLDKFLRAEAHKAGVAVSDLVVSCSSTMDFPEDFTKDPDVVALAKQLRRR